MHPETPTGQVRTVTETIIPEGIPGTSQEPPVLRLRLQKPRNGKKVQWTNGTIDNEHMNKKKSKCCCIYVKPREFGESSSESEDECEHCFGHVELKKKNRHPPTDMVPDSSGIDIVDGGDGGEAGPGGNGSGNGTSDGAVCTAETLPCPTVVTVGNNDHSQHQHDVDHCDK